MRRGLAQALTIAAVLVAAVGIAGAWQPEGAAPGGAKGKEATMAGPVGGTIVKGKVLPVEIDVRTLPSGLEVALVPWDSPGLAAYFTAMRVGSRDEVEPGHSGFAHLFEHMMFRGTKKMPGGAYDAKVQALGADSSAWTWTDQTVYFFIAPSKSLPEVISMEAERFQNLWYGEPEFKTESGAVLGEYNKNFSDPLNQMEEDLMNLAFERSTYKHTTMGFLKDIKAMPTMYQYSLEFFDKHYVPGKAIVFVVGDFDKEGVMAAIGKEYAGWVKPGVEVEQYEEPEQHGERGMHRSWKNEVLPQILLGYKVPAYDNSNVDHAALSVAGEMVFGKTSPMYRKLVLDDQVAEDISFWDWPHRDEALWMVNFKLKEDRFDSVLALLDQTLKDVSEGKITEERLAAVKSHYRYAFVLGMETPREVANTMSFYATLDGDPASLELFLQNVDKVTLADVKRVVTQYLKKSGRTVITLSHPAEAVDAQDGKAAAKKGGAS